MAKDDDAVAGVIPLDDPAAVPPDEGDVGSAAAPDADSPAQRGESASLGQSELANRLTLQAAQLALPHHEQVRSSQDARRWESMAMLPPDSKNAHGPDLREDRCHAGRTTSRRPVTRQASRGTKKSLHSLRRLGVALGASTSLAVLAVAPAQAASPARDGGATSPTPPSPRIVCPVALSASATAQTPAACPPPPRRNLRAEADGIMRMTYDQFADFSRVHPKPFDWSTDGCSGPKFTKHIYKDLFDKPCRLHDFGYRNYGRGLHLGRNEATRAWIDQRFREEMDRRCNHYTGWQSYKGVACRAEAHVIWLFERKTGNLPGVKGFYG
jgi:hypothetical protein